MISQNLLDQLPRNFEYAFTTRVSIARNRMKQTFYFFLFYWRLKLEKGMQKSIIERQGIAIFLIADIFFLLVRDIAIFILIQYL